MILVDTNILIRLLTKNPQKQVDKIKFFLNVNEQELYITSLVLLETYQVLTGKIYQMKHNKAAQSILELVFNSRVFEIEQKNLHHQTLQLLLQKKTDYTDAFLQTQAIFNENTILSFDNDFDKLEPKMRVKF